MGSVCKVEGVHIFILLDFAKYISKVIVPIYTSAEYVSQTLKVLPIS